MQILTLCPGPNHVHGLLVTEAGADFYNAVELDQVPEAIIGRFVAQTIGTFLHKNTPKVVGANGQPQLIAPLVIIDDVAPADLASKGGAARMRWAMAWQSVAGLLGLHSVRVPRLAWAHAIPTGPAARVLEASRYITELGYQDDARPSPLPALLHRWAVPALEQHPAMFGLERPRVHG